MTLLKSMPAVIRPCASLLMLTLLAGTAVLPAASAQAKRMTQALTILHKPVPAELSAAETPQAPLPPATPTPETQTAALAPAPEMTAPADKAMSSPVTAAPKPEDDKTAATAPAAAPVAPGGHPPASPTPFIRIKFDKPDVKFQDSVTKAVTQLLQKYPDAQFDVVGVRPVQGNAAQMAIDATKSRRNAESVARTLNNIGVKDGNVKVLSTASSMDTPNSEVDIYLR